MTIDEAIEIINHYLDYPIEVKKALLVVIGAVRKYQKIEQIVKNTQQVCSYGSAFIDIREEVEDGNDD